MRARPGNRAEESRPAWWPRSTCRTPRTEHHTHSKRRAGTDCRPAPSLLSGFPAGNKCRNESRRYSARSGGGQNQLLFPPEGCARKDNGGQERQRSPAQRFLRRLSRNHTYIAFRSLCLLAAWIEIDQVQAGSSTYGLQHSCKDKQQVAPLVRENMSTPQLQEWAGVKKCGRTTEGNQTAEQ